MPSFYSLKVTPIQIPDLNEILSQADLLYWVYDNISYDVNKSNSNWMNYFYSNIFLNPKDTMLERKGICTGRAVLTCSIMKYYGYPCWLKGYYAIHSDFKITAHIYPCTKINETEHCINKII